MIAAAMLLRALHIGRWFLAALGIAPLLSLAVRYRAWRGHAAPSSDTKMRVLFLHRDLPFHGGVPRCILYLARACDRQRIAVHVASFRDHSTQMSDAFGELGIQPQSIGDAGYFRPALRLRRLLRAETIDVVVGTSFKAYLVAKIATVGLSARPMFWVHAVYGAVNGPIRRAILKKLAHRDPLLFVSEAVRKAHLPADHAGRSAVIYNGVEDVADHPAYAPYSRATHPEFNLPPGALVLAYIAEYTAWKDHATLIAAMDEVTQRGVNAHLLLMGKGELMEATKAAAAKTAAKDRIHFLGARSDARRILGLADAYVHPSRGEGFGLAVVEAMLAGLPVIVARDGAMVEYVSHGLTGMLFRPGDPSDLAGQIVELAEDLPGAIEIGRAGRQRCLEMFAIEPFADAICDFIESTIPIRMTKQTQGRAGKVFHTTRAMQ